METQKLRRQSETQTEVLRQQVAISQRQAELFAEQVLMSIRPFVMCELTEIKPGFRCLGTLWNPTDRIAYDLRVLVHDRTGFYWSEDPPVIRKAGEPTTWSAQGPVVAEDALKFGPEHVYGKYKMDDHLAYLSFYSNKNYVAVFFRDVNGNIYKSFSLITSYHNEYRLSRAPDYTEF